MLHFLLHGTGVLQPELVSCKEVYLNHRFRKGHVGLLDISPYFRHEFRHVPWDPNWGIQVLLLIKVTTAPIAIAV